MVLLCNDNYHRIIKGIILKLVKEIKAPREFADIVTFFFLFLFFILFLQISQVHWNKLVAWYFKISSNVGTVGS